MRAKCVLGLIFLLQIFPLETSMARVTQDVDNPYQGEDPKAAPYRIDDRTQKEIVYFHNKVRREVEPPAEDMRKMVYDEKLALAAQTQAKQCNLDHEKDRGISDEESKSANGQNIAVGANDWQDAMSGWAYEAEKYLYGVEPSTYLRQGVEIEHYTQMVQNATVYIGCGFAECKKPFLVKYYVCNYASGSPTDARDPKDVMVLPYTAGKRCNACSSCENGLCGCGILECLNGGVFDEESCRCKCPNGYQGTDCSGSQSCDGKKCLNGGILDGESCECNCPGNYFGTDCKERKCTVRDSPNCGSTYTDSQCAVDFVRRSCPAMCRLCSPTEQK